MKSKILYKNILLSTLGVFIFAFFAQGILNSVYRNTLDERIHDTVEATRLDLEAQFNQNEVSQNLIQSYAKEGYFIEIKDKFNALETESKTLQDLKHEHEDHYETILKYFGSEFAIYDGKIHLDKDYDLSIYTFRPNFIHEDEMLGLENFDEALFWITVGALISSLIGALWISTREIKEEITFVNVLKNISLNEHFIPTKSQKAALLTLNHLSFKLSQQKDLIKDASNKLSHELRTPITALNLIFENIEYGLIEMNAGTIQNIQSEITRIQKLAEDLKTLEDTKLELLDEPKEETDLQALLDHVIFLFSIEAQNKKVETKLDLKVTSIFVSKYRFLQVLINLYSNAIKYTNTFGTITIRSFIKNQNIHIQIMNTIDEKVTLDHQSIFDAYVTTQGEGLGLNITQEMLHAQNASVKVIEHNQTFGFEIVLNNY